MTTKTATFNRILHHSALLCTYTAAARDAAGEGDRAFAVGELRNAAECARLAASAAEALATSLATKRVSK